MAKSFKIEVDLYNQRVRLLVTKDYDEVEKFIRKKWKDKNWTVENDDCEGNLFWHPDYAPIIHIHKKPKTPFQKGILAHEIFHCTSFLLRAAGLKLTEESEEAFSYLHGFLTEKIWEKLEKL